MISEMRWWHNLPQCKVGDLVVFKNRKLPHRPMIVIKVNPKKPCRVNPVQSVTVFRTALGRESVYEAKQLEVINESR